MVAAVAAYFFFFFESLRLDCHRYLLWNIFFFLLFFFICITHCCSISKYFSCLYYYCLGLVFYSCRSHQTALTISRAVRISTSFGLMAFFVVVIFRVSFIRRPLQTTHYTHTGCQNSITYFQYLFFSFILNKMQTEKIYVISTYYFFILV